MKVGKEYGKPPMSCFVLHYVGSQVPTKDLEDDGVSFASSLTEPVQSSALQCSRALGQVRDIRAVTRAC